MKIVTGLSVVAAVDKELADAMRKVRQRDHK